MVSIKFVSALLVLLCFTSTFAVEISGRSTAFQRALRSEAVDAEMMEINSEVELEATSAPQISYTYQGMDMSGFSKFGRKPTATPKPTQAPLTAAQLIKEAAAAKATYEDLSSDVEDAQHDVDVSAKKTATCLENMKKSKNSASQYRAESMTLVPAEKRTRESLISVSYKANMAKIAWLYAQRKADLASAKFLETESSAVPASVAAAERNAKSLAKATEHVTKAESELKSKLASISSASAAGLDSAKTSAEEAAGQLRDANNEYTDFLMTIKKNDFWNM